MVLPVMKDEAELLLVAEKARHVRKNAEKTFVCWAWNCHCLSIMNRRSTGL